MPEAIGTHAFLQRFERLGRPEVPNRLPPRLFSHVKGWGPSLMLGTGAVGNHSHINRLASMPGLAGATRNNYGIGGSALMWDHSTSNCGYSRTLQDVSATIKAQTARPYAPWPTGENHLCVVDGGGSELYSYASQFESYGADARVTIPKAIMARKTMISRCLAAFVVENGSLTFSTSPTWAGSAALNANSGTNMTYTNQSGAYCEYTTPGSLPPGAVVVFGGTALQGTGAQAVFTNESSGSAEIGTLDITALRPRATGKYNGWVKRFRVGTGPGELAPYTAHTLRCTFNSVGGFGGLIDYVQVETPNRWQPLVLVPNFAKFYSDTAFWGTDLADRLAITDEYNAALEAMVEEFATPSIPGMPNPVRIVDFDSFVNRQWEFYAYERPDLYTIGDGVHYGDRGYAKLAGKMYETILDWYSETHDFQQEAIGA